LAANPPDLFGENRDKSILLSTVIYSAASLMLRAYFLLEVLDILFRYMASSILANTDIKKSKPIGFCLIQNKHQNQHKKMGH